MTSQTSTEPKETHSSLPCFLTETSWDHHLNRTKVHRENLPNYPGVCALFTWPPHAAVSPDVLAKRGQKRGQKSESASRRTMLAPNRQTQPGPSPCGPGRNQTWAPQDTKMSLPTAIKAALKEGNRSTSVHTRTIQIKSRTKPEESYLKKKKKKQEQASLARINHSDQAWHTVHIVHIPPAYLQLLLCCPLYFSLLSVRINTPPASTKENSGSGSECGDKCSILYPTRGNLQGCNPSTTTAQQLYCTARPAGS